MISDRTLDTLLAELGPRVVSWIQLENEDPYFWAWVF